MPESVFQSDPFTQLFWGVDENDMTFSRPREHHRRLDDESFFLSEDKLNWWWWWLWWWWWGWAPWHHRLLLNIIDEILNFGCWYHHFCCWNLRFCWQIVNSLVWVAVYFHHCHPISPYHCWELVQGQLHRWPHIWCKKEIVFKFQPSIFLQFILNPSIHRSFSAELFSLPVFFQTSEFVWNHHVSHRFLQTFQPKRRGWEGGLGSQAFAQLMMRLAALVLVIATAQTCRKYVSLVQVELR
jgi:hypothetical protein